MKQRLSLKGRALQWLAQREHSRLELRRKLLPHAEEEQAEALRGASPGAAGTERLSWDATDDRPPSPLGAEESAAAYAIAAPEPDATTPEARVEAVLDWLQTRRYLCEERFVESRVNARTSRFGHLRIRQELAQHGLELPPENLRALQDSEFARAHLIWKRKFGGEIPTDVKARARQMRFLAGRGFGGDVIRRVLQGEIEG